MRRSTLPFCLRIIFLTLLGAAACWAAPLELHYQLRIERPTEHLAEIEIVARHVHDASLDFVMPAWSPGRYAIYEFSKNVQEFEARGANRRPLPWSQPDLNTWRVDARAADGEVLVRYRVFGNDLNGTFSQVDSTHANLNGASIFMYVSGHQQDPLELSLDAPAGWQVISGFSLATDQRQFETSSYDRLIDTPMELTDAATLDQFKVKGKTFRVAVHAYEPGESADGSSPPPANPANPGPQVTRLVDGIHKIVEAEMAIMPPPDFDHYTFILHFAEDVAEGDGMEHLNSTQIVISQPLSEGGISEAWEDAAHEFFHVWNVKRLRPAGLGPFDYQHEVNTPSLWFAEGVTSYYSYVALLRAGLWTRAQFLARLAGEIHHLDNDPGRKLMSAESSSFHAWFYDRAPQMQETNFANSTINYYNKGALLGLLLDLEIRGRTQGAHSLDDVMRMLYHEFYETPAGAGGDGYLPGRGYEEKDLLAACNAVSSSDFRGFFADDVAGVAALPYDADLARAGLQLKVSVSQGSAPSLGVLTQPAATGVRIVAIRPGGAADRAGLSRDDLLIDADELSLATDSLDDRLKIYPAGSAVPFTVQRHLTRFRATVKLDPPVPDEYSIQDLPNATAGQVSVRKGWLGQ